MDTLAAACTVHDGYKDILNTHTKTPKAISSVATQMGAKEREYYRANAVSVGGGVHYCARKTGAPWHT